EPQPILLKGTTACHPFPSPFTGTFSENLAYGSDQGHLRCTVFQKMENNNQVATSTEDRQSRN
ncbi:hypothetical protein E2320_003786, partial [Naja naja]